MKIKNLCLSAVLLLSFWMKGEGIFSQQVSVVRGPDLSQRNKNYVSNRAPLLPSVFIKLPVESIEPGGWLKECLDRQKNGLSGNLGKISAWLEKKGNAWLSPDGKGDHGWEEVPYWLRGYSSMAYLYGDKKMLKETKIWIGGMLASQRADGFFGPWLSPHDKDKPDLWPNMLALFCLESYYEYSKDPKVLSFMDKYFRWETTVKEENFMKNDWDRYRVADNLYSVYWLYNRTGEKYLLDLATKLHKASENWMNNLPTWHNVNIAQGFREPGEYYLQGHDSAYMKASYDDFYTVRHLFGQVPGGMFGGDENCRFGYYDPRQGVETCGMVEQMFSDEIMMRISGDPIWADNCENVAFNTYPAALMPDMKSLRYLTAPNMVQSDSANHSPGIDNSGPFLMMNPFSSRCCQHNHGFGWPYYAENLWLASSDKGLVAALYSQCHVNAKVEDGVELSLREETKYPFESGVKIIVEKISEEAEFPIYLRIPLWCKGAYVMLNGEKKELEAGEGNYIKIWSKWRKGDTIDLYLPMQLKVNRWVQNGNSLSVNYGALTFSLKIKERYVKSDSRSTAIGDSKWQATADPAQWPSFQIYPDSPWNYALKIGGENLPESFKLVRKEWPKDNYPFTPESCPLEIKTEGKQVAEWSTDRYGLCSPVPKSPVVETGSLEDITLIPMGAARLRISAFPVLKN